MSKEKTKNEKLTDEAMINVNKDRDITKALLDDAYKYILSQRTLYSPEEYSKILASTSKLVENLTKANEQIIRVLELEAKRKKPVEDGGTISDDEVEKFYEKAEEVEIG